ncbi:MAG TPA: histidine kinase dimerization/phospho-acceptor domain-containing protein, partial [Ohtaekwangia sp.]
MNSSIVKLLAGFILLLLLGWVSLYFSTKEISNQSLTERIAENLNHEIDLVETEAEAVLKQLESDSFPGSLSTRDLCPFYGYDRDSLIYWSDNTFVPTPVSVADTFTLKLIKGGNSDYLARKWTLRNGRSLVYLIPLFRKYNISNNYLSPEWNTTIFPHRNIAIHEPNEAVGIPVCVNGICPFKVSFLQDEIPAHGAFSTLGVTLICFAIALLIGLVYLLVKRIKYPEPAFVVYFFFLLGLRILMTRLNFPGRLIQSDLFDPQVFASSSLNASLGDLILNEIAVLLLCFYIFRNYFRLYSLRWIVKHAWASWLLSVFAALCVLFAALFPFVVIQTLYNNSTIVLDISQSLEFNSYRLLALIAVILAGVSSFLFAHAFMRLLVSDRSPMRIVMSFVAAILLFGLINTLTEQEYLSSLVVGSCYFLAVYGLKLYTSLKKLSFSTFAYLFVAVFFMAANSAFGVQYFSRKEKIENLFRFATNFLIDRDYFGEYLLAETSRKVSEDVFIQTRIASPFFGREAIRQKIRQVFLPSYFNKYDVEIFLFSAAGEALDNRTTTTFAELIKAYNRATARTPYEGIYLISSPSPDVSQRYLDVIPVTRFGAIVGYIVLELSLKKVIPENVYPELLVDNRFQQFYKAEDLSYAVFASGRMLLSSGTYNYESLFDKRWLTEPAVHTIGMVAHDYDHIAQEDENGRTAVVSSRHTSVTFVLANFSFLLVLGLVIILVFIIIQGLVNFIEGGKLYFSARIQLLLNLAFFLPLIVVSIVTLSLINRTSHNQLSEEYLNKAKTVGEQLAAGLSAPNDHESFENQVTDLAKLTNLDLNVYDLNGYLLATSQPLIVENNLISQYINPVALEKVKSGDPLFVETDKVGKLSYYVSYAALKSPTTGQLVGILGIPFFQSGVFLEKVQITILANILNIFALIFMVLVVVAYVVSKWLTFPLTFMTQSLKRTSLTKTNSPLVWKSDDEIGMMVKEYNQMLYNLSESKAELEQTQRERTWREIAQQVAHEIKNPLTPMKLTLQQLERSLKEGVPSASKTEKAVSSLLTQVDTLNDIASSFSSFAKMPEPVIHRIDLISLLQRITELHSHSGDIVFKPVVKEFFVEADEQLLGRTFSNIILNAFQAARPGEVLTLT